MTEAINYIQSLFSFNSLAPATFSRHDAKLVKALIKDAKTLVTVADQEAGHGATAEVLSYSAEKSNNPQLACNMAIIAIWHLERALGKYQQASARYNEAGKIQTAKSKIFFAEAKEMAKRADETAAALKSLLEVAKQN